MFNNLYLIVVFILLHIQLTAQDKFPGFYINSAGETVNGVFPKFRDWVHNPTKVQFETNTGNQLELTPSICKSFTVTGYETYESMQVKRMTNPNRFSSNNESAVDEEIFENFKVFLRKVYDEASVKLYIFRDSKRENYFIKVNDTLTELYFRVVFRKDVKTGNDQLFEDKKYVEQLKSFFESQIDNDKKLAKDVVKLRYTENDLVSFLNRVLETKAAKHKNKYPPELALIGGASYNTFKVGPFQQFTYPTTLSYSSKISPVIGIRYTDYSRGSFGKNMYAIELKYYSLKHAATRIDDNSAERIEDKWEYKADIFTIGFSVGRKWVDRGSFAWYTSVVPTGMLLANNKEIRTYLNRKETVEGRTILFRVGFQTGFIFRRAGVWLLYNFPRSDIQRYLHYDSFHQSVQAGLDWRFKL